MGTTFLFAWHCLAIPKQPKQEISLTSLVNQAVNEESDPQNTESRPFTLNTHPTKDPSVLLAAQVSSKLEEGQCA
jgi:hypothetical protein